MELSRFCVLFYSCALIVCISDTLVNGVVELEPYYFWSVNTHCVKANYGNAGVLWSVLLLVSDNKWHVMVDSVFSWLIYRFDCI